MATPPQPNREVSVTEDWNISRTKNKGAKIKRRPRAPQLSFAENLGLGCLAGGVIGPIAVEADHTPFNPLAEAGEAAVLDDGVSQGMERAVVQLHRAAAIAARDVVGLPGPEGDLMDIGIGHDLQPGIPER